MSYFCRGKGKCSIVNRLTVFCRSQRFQTDNHQERFYTATDRELSELLVTDLLSPDKASVGQNCLEETSSAKPAYNADSHAAKN